jgi:hypothetical protein
MVDPEKLAEMRAFAAECREDLAERLEQDPFLDTPVMREAPAVIYKTRDDSAYAAREPASPAFDQETIIDAVVEALAVTRGEMRAEFEARIAVLEARLETLLTLLGADGARAKAARKRNADVGLLEAPRDRDRA